MALHSRVLGSDRFSLTYSLCDELKDFLVVVVGVVVKLLDVAVAQISVEL